MNSEAAFDQVALSATELSTMRGSFLPARSRTFGSVVRLADNQARDDFRQASGVASAALDIWFTTTGLSLIANNLLDGRR